MTNAHAHASTLKWWWGPIPTLRWGPTSTPPPSTGNEGPCPYHHLQTVTSTHTRTTTFQQRRGPTAAPSPFNSDEGPHLHQHPQTTTNAHASTLKQQQMPIPAPHLQPAMRAHICTTTFNRRRGPMPVPPPSNGDERPHLHHHLSTATRAHAHTTFNSNECPCPHQHPQMMTSPYGQQWMPSTATTGPHQHPNDGLWQMAILSLQDQDVNGRAIASLVSVLRSSCFIYSKYINRGFLMVWNVNNLVWVPNDSDNEFWHCSLLAIL